MNPSQEITFFELQDYLSRIARKLSHTYEGYESDELLQEMNVHILERAAQDPTFLDQQPGYITRAAAWHVRTWVRDQYDNRRIGLNLEADEDEPSEWMAAPVVDQDTIIDVQDALASLSGRVAEVAQMLMAGWKATEIASELGCSKATITYYKNQLRAALAPVMAA